MEPKLNTRKYALINLYNQMLQELVGNEFNLSLLQKKESFSTVLDLNLATNININKDTIQKIRSSLTILLQMIAEQEKADELYKKEEQN